MSATDLLREWYAHYTETHAAPGGDASGGGNGGYGSSRASTRSASLRTLPRRGTPSPRSGDAAESSWPNGAASASASPIPSAMTTARRGGADQHDAPGREHASFISAGASILTYAPLALKEKDATLGISFTGADPPPLRVRRATPKRSEASRTAALRVREAVSNERRAKAEECLWLDAQLEVRKQREEELNAKRLERKLRAGDAAAAPKLAGSRAAKKQQILGGVVPFDVVPVERCKLEVI